MTGCLGLKSIINYWVVQKEFMRNVYIEKSRQCDFIRLWFVKYLLYLSFFTFLIFFFFDHSFHLSEKTALCIKLFFFNQKVDLRNETSKFRIETTIYLYSMDRGRSPFISEVLLTSPEPIPIVSRRILSDTYDRFDTFDWIIRLFNSFPCSLRSTRSR